MSRKNPGSAPNDREFVQGLARGFAVIRAFGADARNLTISEVAVRTSLTRAVARRYLLTLQELGCVVQHGPRFALTPRILDLGFTYLATIDVANIAQPIMEEIANTFHESCSAAVLDGNEVVYVARVQAKRIMSVNLIVGSRLPAHATSMGKVLLAHLPAEDLEAYFASSPLKALTPRTITRPDVFRQVLKEVSERGWAFSDQESEAGVRTVAVPIFNHANQVEAALNVSAHAARVTMRDLKRRYLPVLVDAGRRISRALGSTTSDARGHVQVIGPRTRSRFPVYKPLQARP